MDTNDGPGSNWARARALFERALELAPDDRTAFLERECSGNDELKHDVLDLLRADAATGGMLDAPLDAAAADFLDGVPADATRRTGTEVGAWRLLEELGHGGMGVVYLAERADHAYEQRAALKLVRGGLVSGALEKRFLRERQILARLQHPGIARLLDGGFTGEGQPYLVMELVEGEPVTDWAARNGLDVRQRLQLFLEVCDAVQYAHRQLVVHRDLKPANILVTAEGRVRLLDFGVARLLDDATEEAGLTRTGMLLLTPEYAAPEQIRGEPATTATDVYGLGAVLYELLSGKRIRQLDSPAFTDVLRTVQAEIPRLVSHEDLSASLRRRLSGDLETIVHCALASEPERRYPTVDALAADVRGHLDDRPVLARPDSVRYRLGKYLRRHRLGVTVSAAIAVLLALGVAGTLWQAQEARREASRAREMSAFLQDLFTAVEPEDTLGRVVTARELLDIGAARIDNLRADPDVRVDVLLTLGDLYYRLGVFDQAEALLVRAEREAVAAFGENHVRTVEVQNSLGYIFTETGRYDDAEAVVVRALAASRRLDDPLVLSYSIDALANLRSDQGRYDESRNLRRELLDLNTRLHGANSWEVAATLQALGTMEMDLQNFGEADRLLAEALRREREIVGSLHPSVANTLEVIAVLKLGEGRPREAEPYQREALAIRTEVLGEDHPDVARSLDQIALILQRQNRGAEAVELYERALELRRRVLGAKHARVADTLTNLASVDYQAGDLTGALARQREALDIYREAFGEEHPLVANGMSNLGAILRELRQFDEAEPILNRTLDLRRQLLGEEHTDVAVSLLHLAILHRRTDRLPAAEQEFRQALAIFAARLPEDHPRLAETRMGLGATLVLAGRAAESLPLLESAFADVRARIEGDDVRVAESQLWLGMALARLSRAAEALPHLQASRTVFAALRGAEHDMTQQAAEELDGLQRRLAGATAASEQ
ncbi:MAG: tetratricopeptide repeat protein [Woeseiaceae bacterium]